MSDAKTEPTAIPPHVEHFMAYASALSERIAGVVDKESNTAVFVALGMMMLAQISAQPDGELPTEIREMRERLRYIVAMMVKSAPEVTLQ